MHNINLPLCARGLGQPPRSSSQHSSPVTLVQCGTGRERCQTGTGTTSLHCPGCQGQQGQGEAGSKRTALAATTPAHVIPLLASHKCLMPIGFFNISSLNRSLLILDTSYMGGHSSLPGAAQLRHPKDRSPHASQCGGEIGQCGTFLRKTVSPSSIPTTGSRRSHLQVHFCKISWPLL